MSKDDDEKPREKTEAEITLAANEQLSKILVSALRANTDPETLSAIAALRSRLRALGCDLNDAQIWRKEDRSRIASDHTLMLDLIRKSQDDYAKMREYQKRCAVLEAVFLEVKRLTRGLPAINASDYRLKSEAQNVNLRKTRDWVV